MNIDNDIECKKWCYTLIGMGGLNMEMYDKLLYPTLMNVLEKINTSSDATFRIEMTFNSWVAHKNDEHNHFFWSEHNGMLGALKEAIYYIYREMNYEKNKRI